MILGTSLAAGGINLIIGVMKATEEAQIQEVVQSHQARVEEFLQCEAESGRRRSSSSEIYVPCHM